MEPDAPSLLNVLRVCDIPDVLGMLAPRRLVLSGFPEQAARRVQAVYEAAGARDQLSFTED
jgi:hypothetical protein